MPNDPRVAGIRFKCRTAALTPPYIAPNTHSVVTNPSPADIESLSKHPTFDCSRARSLTARTMCSDEAGASADWDLITAYWARYFSLPEADRHSFDQAQQDWLNSLNQKCPRAQNPQQCVLTAYHKRAASYRSRLAGDALAESRLSPEQHARIQQSLIALGYLTDSPDGEFGSNTRAAIRQFKAQSGDTESDFLTAEQRAELLQGTPSASQPSCHVQDPTGTPLNVREAPNGAVVATLTNGTSLQVLGTQADSRGRDWALITRRGEDRAIGWVFRDYIDCSPTETAPKPTPPAPLPSPRKETARLKEARIFLDDAKKFIGQQTSVPSISEMAKKLQALQLALNQFDERGAVESMQRLNDLLKPIPGFADFEQQQQAERNREEARHLSEGRIQAKKNEFFIDGYLRGHLGDPTTQPLLSLRAQIEGALKSNTIEEITKANEAVALFVKNNGLSEAYIESAKRFDNPEPPLPRKLRPLPDILPEKSKFIVIGPAEEIVLLYNASPTAPKVWKNVRGDVVFQDETASLCFAQPTVELGVARYIDHYLGDHGARKVTSASPPCELSSAEKTTDIIAFRRGNLMNNREDYILALAKLLEGDTFRMYETISNYDSTIRDRQKLSLQIESDLENGSRKGFGVISVTETPVACVVPPSKVEWSDGLKELLKRNADVIAPTITSDWQYVDTSTTNLAFLGLQRHQCGYLLGAEGDLREIMLALRREKMKYALAPVWWDEKDVVQATFDVHDAVQQELRKKLDVERKRKEEEALQAERDKNKQSQKSEIERKLREANGTKARGLMNYIHDLVSGMAEKRAVENADLFPTYSNWLDQRFADQWETFNVNSDVADFGITQWEDRPLDAVIVKTIVHQKNRILGKYEDRCYLFGFVDDDEFNMLRNPFAFDCGDAGKVNNWKVGERFQSRWNAD